MKSLRFVSECKNQVISAHRKVFRMRFENLVSLAGVSVVAVLASGCGGFSSTGGNTVQPADTALHGTVFGGQQPVVGATIQLYQAGATGYGMGATPLLNATVTTGPDGSFTISGKYNSCTTGSEVYITATSGDPGGGVNNPALALMAGLGYCEDLGPGTDININEVTTVATVWSLSRFATDLDIGTSSTNNAGIVAAFSDIPTIVDIATGSTPGATPTGASVPSAEINTLADILAACVNSNGGTGSGTPCGQLFSNATSSAGTAPTDTIAAAENMATQPGKNVAALMALAAPDSPFQPTVTSLNDFTVGITYTGDGFETPSDVAIDANSNVWISNYGGNSVTEISHTGTPLSGAGGFTAGLMSEPSSLAIDLNGNVWISNYSMSTLTELTSAGTNSPNSPYSGGGITNPSGVAIDDLGDVWVSNASTSNVSVFTSTGTPLSPNNGYSADVSVAVGVAINPF